MRPWFLAFIPKSIIWLNILSVILFLAAISVFAVWKKNLRDPHGNPGRRILAIASALTIAGISAMALSFILANTPGGSTNNERTLMESIEPTPERYQIQRDGSTATVSGFELQAKSCPQETSSFTITSLEQGDRVKFSLKGSLGGNQSGSYTVTTRGAGISENYRISGGSIQRINVTVQETGELNITISAQHRPLLGSSCDATKEVLAIEDAVLDQ